MENEQHITITHFINPQLFWYHKIDVPNEHFHEVTILEQELQAFYKDKPIANRQHQPIVGDIVAVCFLSWNRFIRARVDNVAHFNASADAYVVWALDYGFPFQTKLLHIRRLPESFLRHIDHIRCGGLANILPAEKEYDFIEIKPIMSVKDNWNQRACESLEKLVNDADSVTFVENFVSDGHFWGELKIVNHLGNTFFARDYLIGINMGIDKDPKQFRDICKSLKTIKIPHWLSNEKNNKFKQNILNCPFVDRTYYNSNGESACNDIAKRKVEDWNARNERVSGSGVGVFECHSIEHSIDTGSIDDIGFEDSVSIKHQRDLDPVEMKGFVRLGGLLNKAKCEKYAKGVTLPQPPNEAFEVKNMCGSLKISAIDSNAVPNTDIILPPSLLSESISSRKQKLIEIRRKLAAKQAEHFNTSSQNETTIDSTFKVQYEPLEESTLDETVVDEMKLNMRSITLGEETNASEISYQSSRAKNLIELRLKRAKIASIVKNDFEPSKDDDRPASESSSSFKDKLKQIKQKHSQAVVKGGDKDDNDEAVSTSSGAASSYAEYLRNTRKKIKEKTSKQAEAEHTKNESIIDSKISTANENCDATFQESDLDANKEVKTLPDFKQKSSSIDPFDGMTVIPAGFDLANLNRYKDEKNHWHRKKTTRFDHIPHDSIIEAEELQLNTTKNTSTSSSSSSKNFNASTENDTHNSINITGAKSKIKSNKNQNFRHTRSHTDKYKGEFRLLENEFCASEEEGNFASQTLLDAAIPSLNVTALTPLISEEANVLSDENKFLNVSNCSLTKAGGDILEEKHSASDFSLNKKYKRRQLKPPAEQMNMMDKLLQRAKFEREQGNHSILDLRYLNQSCTKSNSDLNTKMNSPANDNETSENEINESPANRSSSNARALLESVRSSETKESREKKLNAKLDQLEKQISAELSMHKKSKFFDPKLPADVEKPIKSSKIIELPHAQKIREISGEKKIQTKFIENLVLAHSKVPLQPLEKISDAYFLQEIHDEMVNMRVTKVYRVQAYAWSHLLRGNSLFVVNPTKSGKTWCYLPPICSLVSYRIQNSALPENYGPVAIIIVPSSTHVEQVNSYCRRLLIKSKSKVTTVPSFGVRNSKDAKIQLLNTCGILVVTPANLLRLLQSDKENEHLIDPARLQHLVIDDLDTILSRSSQDFEDMLRALLKMVKKSKQSTIPLQVVITSRDWNVIMQSMIRLCNQPLLLIGDFLEAAVYGKVDLSVKLCSQEQKSSNILRFIEKHPQTEEDRVIILCNTDEDMDDVVLSITAAGYPCIGYGSSSFPEIRVTIEEWKKKSLCSQILVCTDAALPELQIKNANILIHYSMPSSWTKFTSRFATLAQSYENFVANNFTRSSSVPVAYSLVLLDEDNGSQLPRLIDFMKKHHQSKNIHPDILAVSKRVLLEREESRIFKGTLLCPYFLEFGECDEPRCDYRHNLTRFDAITKGDDIPTSGELRIKVLKVFSPTHYTARLLEHKSLKTSKWNVVRSSDKVSIFGMQLNMYYMEQENWIVHWPININDICVYKMFDTCHRVRVLDMPQIKHVDIVKKIYVTVKLIDIGTIVTSCKSDDLYVCGKQFKDFPAQAIDIRLMGIVPFDNERNWDSKSTKIVENWIVNDIGKNECVNVDINFALAKTIWVKNVIVMERLPTVRQYIYRINLKRSLIEKNFGCLMSSNKRQSIRDIAEEFGLLIITEEDAQEKIDHSLEFGAQDVEEIQEKIRDDNCNDISSLIKFSSNEDVSFLIENEQQKSTKNLNSDTKVAEKPLDDQEENWDNLQEENKKYEVFVPLSDFGLPSTRKASNKTTRTTENNRQAKEEWGTLTLHSIIKVEIGDEMENGNWKDIYMQLMDETHMQKLRELIQIIDEHVETIKQTKGKQTYLESNWFKPMQNCIINYDNAYCRAKLHGVFGNANDKEIYRFFLCDLACFVTIDAQNLFSDFLYETTPEIVEYTPYQAFHCKLAGINLDEFAKRHPVIKDHLYAYAVSERKEIPKALQNFGIHSFEILLYECDQEKDLSTGTMLNKSLLEYNIATPDPETKHFLELETDSIDFTKFGISNVESHKTELENNKNKGIVSFEELLQVITTANELDAEEALDDLENVDEKRRIKMSLVETKAICRAAIEHQKKEQESKRQELADVQENKISQKNTIDRMRHGKESDEDPLLTSFSSANTSTQSLSFYSTDNSSVLKLTDPPPLTSYHKRPKTEWYETDCLIYLVIHAPDINDYYLEVTQDTLIFAAVVNGEDNVLILNLLGTIEPQHVSHEIRGLNVVVRLVKSIFMKWPRLVQQETKFPWLTYNYNAIDMNGIEKIQPQQRIHLALEHSAGRRTGATNKSFDSETDDEEDALYTTFTPIVNHEDFHDPTADIF